MASYMAYKSQAMNWVHCLQELVHVWFTPRLNTTEMHRIFVIHCCCSMCVVNNGVQWKCVGLHCSQYPQWQHYGRKKLGTSTGPGMFLLYTSDIPVLWYKCMQAYNVFQWDFGTELKRAEKQEKKPKELFKLGVQSQMFNGISCEVHSYQIVN